MLEMSEFLLWEEVKEPIFASGGTWDGSEMVHLDITV